MDTSTPNAARAKPRRRWCQYSVLMPAVVAGTLLIACSREAGTQLPPPVYEQVDKHGAVEVQDAKLFAFEQAERKRIASDDGTSDVFLFACSSSSIILADPPRVSNPRELLVLTIRGESGTLRHLTDFGDKQSQRDLTADRVCKLRTFATTSGADDLPRLIGRERL